MTNRTLDVPSKKPRVMFLCDESLKDALEAWAEKESRTVSNLCELIVKKAAQDAGFLKDSESPIGEGIQANDGGRES